MESDFPIYWTGVARNMSSYHAVKSALCRLSSYSADLFIESYDLMAVIVTDYGSINSFCTFHTDYSVSFPVQLFVMSTLQYPLSVGAFTMTITL